MNYNNYELIDLYYERINIINNINNYSPKSMNKILDFIENEILKREKGWELLINLQIIAESRRELEYGFHHDNERKFIFLKLIQCISNCEKILNLKKNILLSYDEIIFKNWISLQDNIEKIIEFILFCGSIKSIK